MIFQNGVVIYKFDNIACIDHFRAILDKSLNSVVGGIDRFLGDVENW